MWMGVTFFIIGRKLQNKSSRNSLFYMRDVKKVTEGLYGVSLNLIPRVLSVWYREDPTRLRLLLSINFRLFPS